MNYELPSAVADRFSEAASEMLRKEVRERAHRLRRLGYSKKQVTDWLKDNVAWEYELTPTPKVAKEIQKLAGEAFK